MGRITDLEDAIVAVTKIKNGEEVRGFDWNDWNAAECRLRDNGYDDLAECAHDEMIWAYRRMEYGSGML